MSEKVEVLARACAALLAGEMERARALARSECPFYSSVGQSKSSSQKVPPTSKPVSGPTLKRRSLTFAQKLRIWRRDGFRDRYTGQRLVFPGALELLSVLMPEELPYHNPPYGDSRFTHQAMYELWPGIDHVVCHVGGEAAAVHAEDNLVTTAHTNNLAKGSLRVEDLGWTLRAAPGSSDDWDGLLGWFAAYLDRDPGPFSHPVSGPRLAKWYAVVRGSLRSAM